MVTVTITITVERAEPSEQTMERLRKLVADLKKQAGVSVGVSSDNVNAWSVIRDD